MLSLALSSSEMESFNAALVDPKRRVRFKAQLFNKFDQGLATELTLLDGEVVVDATTRSEPTRTAHITLLDPQRRILIDTNNTAAGGLWFSMLIRLWYGVWVRDLNRWVDVPVFHGPIFEVSRHGIEVDIDAQGKEAQHLPPHIFFRSHMERRHTRIHAAIKGIFDRRGETLFVFDTTRKRLARDKAWGPQGSPWKAGQHLADAVDKQLYYRGDGRLRLRDYPEQPAWRFYEGVDAIVVGDAEERFSIADIFNAVLIRGERTVKVQMMKQSNLTRKALPGDTSIFIRGADATHFEAGRRMTIGRGARSESRKITSRDGNQVHFTGNDIDRGHPDGAGVSVRFSEERSRAVIGRAELDRLHPLSDAALTEGKRARVRVENRPGIHKHSRAVDRAEGLLRRMRVGVEQDISFSAVPVPHLEEGDIVRIDVGGVEKRFRLKRFTIPLDPAGPMELNWVGKRIPKRRRRRRG